jgi:hypothetical protein
LLSIYFPGVEDSLESGRSWNCEFEGVDGTSDKELLCTWSAAILLL